jgi:RNA polymerase sigma-70 factor (ECF subfamily)
MSAVIEKEELFKLVKRGDMFAYKTLYRLYYPKLLAISLGYISKKEDAEELVQDVFIKIWVKRKQLDVMTNLDGYLFKMTRNACLDYLKSKSRKLSLNPKNLQLEAALNYHALSNDTASDLLLRELEQQIIKSIDELPEKCRAVFLKSRMEGLKNKEISKELQISHKTVEGHITKAVSHLRVALKEFIYFMLFFLSFFQG